MTIDEAGPRSKGEKPRLEPRQPETYDNETDGFDDDDPRRLRRPDVEVVRSCQGRLVVRYKDRPLPTKTEVGRLEASQSEAWIRLSEELDDDAAAWSERRKSRNTAADVEQGRYEGRCAKAQQRAAGLRKVLGGAVGDGGDDGDYPDDNEEVEAARLGDEAEDQDGEEWRYEGFTNHDFWRAVHPPLPNTPTGKYPPLDKNTVPMPRWVGRVVKAWPERMMLALLAYYFQLSRRDRKIRARAKRNRHLWVAKTDEDMASETMLTPAVVKKYRKRLINAGLIRVEHHRFGRKQAGGTVMLRTCFYRVNWDAVEEAYLEGGGRYDFLRDQGVETGVVLAAGRVYGPGDEHDEDEDDD